MSHSLQTIHMLGKKPNKLYDPHLKTGLGYENPKHLKKAIEAQPKMYNGEKLESTKLKVDLPDYEETLEDAEKSRLKMKDKMIQLDYVKLNALYESFVSQTEILVEQTYFSSPSTSNVFSESSLEKSDLPPKKMHNESKLLKSFVDLDKEIKQLWKLINISLQMEKEKTDIYDEQNETRRYFTQKVILISDSLRKCLTVIKQEITKEVQEIIEIFVSMERKVEKQTQKDELFHKEIDRLLEASLEREIRDCVLISIEQQKKEMLMFKMEKISNKVMNTETQLLVAKSNKFSCNSIGVARSSSVRRPESKDTNSKKIVLLKTKSKSTSKDIKKSQSSVSLVSNKRDTMHSNVSKSNANVLISKTVNVVHAGSNIVCVSCGKYVFMISHDKYVARYALSPNSRVIQIVFWIVDSECSKHMTGNLKLLRNFVEKFIGIGRFGNDNFAAITGYGDYGEDLLTSLRDSNLYTIFISEMVASSPVFLMSKATSIKSWLWHRRLSHLNFGTINHLTKQDLVDGLLRFKYEKDYLCSACEQGKSKKSTFPPKLVPSTNSKLELIHMDLCGPIRVETTPEMIIKFITQIQRNMKVQNLKVRSDNGTEFKNEKLRNQTLVEAARTMLIFSRSPAFLWAEAIFTACFTQNRSLVYTRKMRPKADIGIFVGYSKSSRGFRINNRQTRKIMETIHVKFNELTMASECNNSGPSLNCLNFQDSSEEVNEIPLKEDLDNLFGALYEEYYVTRTPELLDNSVANTLDNEDTPSSSLIIIEDHDAPQIVSSSEEPIANKPTTPVFDNHSDEHVQEDVAELDGNTFMNPFGTPEFEEAKSSSNYQDPSNMHEFHQQHRFTDRWTKNHQIEKVIMSITEPTNIKEAMLDHSSIKSMQDELNQFKRLDVWELVERPVDRNVIKVKWIWKNITDADNTVIQNKSRLIAKGYSQQEGIDFEESFAPVA
ncbi:gag-pol polyprotein [Tanacetum coccineum]